MIKTFIESALIGLYLKKDINNKRGHGTGFAAGLLLIIVGLIILLIYVETT